MAPFEQTDEAREQRYREHHEIFPEGEEPTEEEVRDFRLQQSTDPESLATRIDLLEERVKALEAGHADLGEGASGAVEELGDRIEGLRLTQEDQEARLDDLGGQVDGLRAAQEQA